MTRTNPGVVAAIATVIISILLAAALPGCGVKSAPISPEYARPERILSLRAAPAAGGIMLTFDDFLEGTEMFGRDVMPLLDN